MTKTVIIWLVVLWVASITSAHFVINYPYYQDKLSVFSSFLLKKKGGD